MSTWRNLNLGEKTGISRDTLAHIHGLAVFTECLAGGLACGDQHRRMGSGSTLVALCDNVLYKYTFNLLTETASSYQIRSLIGSLCSLSCMRSRFLCVHCSCREW